MNAETSTIWSWLRGAPDLNGEALYFARLEAKITVNDTGQYRADLVNAERLGRAVSTLIGFPEAAAPWAGLLTDALARVDWPAIARAYAEEAMSKILRSEAFGARSILAGGAR